MISRSIAIMQCFITIVESKFYFLAAEMIIRNTALVENLFRLFLYICKHINYPGKGGRKMVGKRM